jgi:hypothetical protein
MSTCEYATPLTDKKGLTTDFFYTYGTISIDAKFGVWYSNHGDLSNRRVLAQLLRSNSIFLMK